MKCMNYEVRSVFTAVEFLLQMYWRKCVNVPNACPFWSPMNEFDTTNHIDPVARYKHFVDAHRDGELDPAFPYFSVWEMRQVVNCDAPNDQMTWCRKMVSNFTIY